MCKPCNQRFRDKFGLQEHEGSDRHKAKCMEMSFGETEVETAIGEGVTANIEMVDQSGDTSMPQLGTQVEVEKEKPSPFYQQAFSDVAKLRSHLSEENEYPNQEGEISEDQTFMPQSDTDELPNLVEMPHWCIVCNKSFESESDLEEHENEHTSEFLDE